MKTLKWLCVLTLLFVVAPNRPTARVQPYDAFYTFGDSLVDTGNDFIVTQLLGFHPAVPPSVSPYAAYYNHRFSNGPVAFEYLWQRLSGHKPGSRNGLRPLLQGPLRAHDRAINFAFGGSGTGSFEQSPGGFFVPGLSAQVELLRAVVGGRKHPARALYAIFAGAGDYLRPTPPAPTRSVGNILAAVRNLYEIGARDVIVLNLPDLGTIPMFAGGPQSELLSQLSSAHNALLAAGLSALAPSLPDLNLVAIDVSAVLQQLPPSINTVVPALDVLLPSPPGQPPTSLCLFINPATCRDAPTFDVDLQYLFWDAEHPTTGVDQLLAEYIYSQLVQTVPAAFTN